jgi:hypothetical protein
MIFLSFGGRAPIPATLADEAIRALQSIISWEYCSRTPQPATFSSIQIDPE